MKNNPLKVVSVSNKKDPTQASRSNRRMEVQGALEHLWKEDAEQFDPSRNARERERIARSLSMLKKPKGRLADLGCGAGQITKELAKLFQTVDAVDISTLALKKLEEKKLKNVVCLHDYVPRTTLQDEAYDAITCLELIAYLPKDEYRLLFSELARLIKPEGTLICSTPIDVDSEDALQRFASLAESEFVIEEWLFSWHKLYLSLRNFTEAPTRFFKSYKDPKYRARQIERRRGFFKAWFRLNSSTIPQILWCPLHFLTSPIASWIRQSRSLLLFCEKICRLLYSDQGISHAIFTAKRRPLEFTPKDEQPRETKHKKELWE